MQATDLQMIKDIPGYKVILKTVLKTQIQQLVEQLADHTGEESVLLTASVSDGTLSHLGSVSGKVFLEDHDDIQSQFLGFCMKRHHTQKQTEKDKQQQNSLDHCGTRHSPGPTPRMAPTRVRTSPYTKRTDPSSSPSHSAMPSTPTQSIQSPAVEDDDDSNSSSSTIINEPREVKYLDNIPPKELTLNSDFSNLTEIPTDASKMDTSESKTAGSETGISEVDPNVNIKIEAVAESELDHEIAGVELTQSENSQMSNVKRRRSNGPTASTGAQGDKSGDSSHGNNKDATVGRTKEITCNVCLKTFNRKFALKRHLTIHNAVPQLRCDICNKQFCEMHDLKTHIKTKHHLQSLACTTCLKEFTSRSGLLVHMKTHSGLVYKCTVCQKSFANQSRLERHIVSHTKSHGFICDCCGARFKYKSSLNRHVCKPIHDSKDDRHICAWCGKEYKTRESLRSHEKKHDGSKFSCTNCGKEFHWQWSYTRHIQKCEKPAA